MNAFSELLIATRNEGKLIEVREMLAELPLRFLSLRDFPGIITVDETATSFAGNASLKARGYALQTGAFTLADDSGLEVDALGGEPGIRSTRYAGEAASDFDRVKRLLSNLADFEGTARTARFVAAIAIADPQGTILNVSIGTCEGTITENPLGENGFGYDPIFIPDGYEQTFAGLGSEAKNKISHRAHALEQAGAYLRSLTREMVAR